jgi:hypothetical protein
VLPRPAAEAFGAKQARQQYCGRGSGTRCRQDDLRLASKSSLADVERIDAGAAGAWLDWHIRPTTLFALEDRRGHACTGG